MSYEVQIRRAAELDVAEAQLWYESQRSGLGSEFCSQVSNVLDRLAETPLIFQIAHRDVRRAIVHRFPYLIWYRVIDRSYRSRLHARSFARTRATVARCCGARANTSLPAALASSLSRNNSKV